MSKEKLFDQLKEAIVDGNPEAATSAAKEIISAGLDPLKAISLGATKGLDEIGERYQRLEAFLPDLIRGAEAMKACLAVFTPHINADQRSRLQLGKVVIGTVTGDIHDIGKNMVATMLTVAGFEVHDLGIDVPVKRFIEKAREVNAKVIALSALLTHSSYYQQEVIKYLIDTGQRDKYFVVVGGSPVTPEWAAEIGADGYGRTAIDASQLLTKLVTGDTLPPLPQPVIVQ